MSFPNHRDRRTILFMFLLLAIIQFLPFVAGGICWYEMDTNGYCKETLKYGISKEKCCAGGSSLTAYTAEELRGDALFILRILDKGVPCVSCQETCDTVKCGKNKKCVFRDNKPVCVCSPKCKKLSYRKGPVCGTDNKTYKSVCRLKKQKCRTKDTLLKVNYYGACQTSCKKVKCKRGQYCVQDQYMNAHCVSCDFGCTRYGPRKVPICGDDGVTYQNTCHLQSVACRGGKSITIAYRDKCKVNATCETINCAPGEKCLVHPESGNPRCVSCFGCSEGAESSDIRRLLCGTNNQTYQTWCDMMNDSCGKGYVIEAKYPGSCELSTIIDNAVVRKY